MLSEKQRMVLEAMLHNHGATVTTVMGRMEGDRGPHAYLFTSFGQIAVSLDGPDWEGLKALGLLVEVKESSGLSGTWSLPESGHKRMAARKLLGMDGPEKDNSRVRPS